MKLKANKNDPPVGALIVAGVLKKSFPVSVDWQTETSLDVEGLKLTSTANIIRYRYFFFLNIDPLGRPTSTAGS